MRESKQDRFRRVAEARVNKIIKMVRLLGNCSGSNTYAYHGDQVEQIFTALQIELDTARQRYAETGGPARKRFSLLEAVCAAPAPDTVTNPHITLRLPDGSSLRAVSYAGTDYPAINIYLLRGNEPAELVCFTEYNPERSALCIGAYASDEEDTKYYEPYMAERNQHDGNEKDITDQLG